MATLDLDLQIATEDESDLPQISEFSTWAESALPDNDSHYEVTIRLVDAEESQQLNHQYRGKDKPTNVLSFPFDGPEGLELPLLGDLVVCVPVVKDEAREQSKLAQHHWAHLVIHGILHLRGYDHINDEDAEVMEALEVDLLARLNIPNPYLLNE